MWIAAQTAVVWILCRATAAWTSNELLAKGLDWARLLCTLAAGITGAAAALHPTPLLAMVSDGIDVAGGILDALAGALPVSSESADSEPVEVGGEGVDRVAHGIGLGGELELLLVPGAAGLVEATGQAGHLGEGFGEVLARSPGVAGQFLDCRLGSGKFEVAAGTLDPQQHVEQLQPLRGVEQCKGGFR